MGSDNLNMDSGSVKGIGTKFGIAGGIVLSISVAILTKKLLNFSAISVGLEVIDPLMFKQAVKLLFFLDLFIAKLISSQGLFSIGLVKSKLLFEKEFFASTNERVVKVAIIFVVLNVFIGGHFDRLFSKFDFS